MNLMDRRTFLHTSVLAAAGAAVAPCATAQVAANESALPLPCAPRAWRKRGVILEPTEPWEGNRVQNFTSPAEPLADGAWRVWYSASSKSSGFGLAYAEGVPGQPMKKVPAHCSPGDPPDALYSIGNLPEKWRPTQGIHIRLCNGSHRLYFWAHGPKILRYLAADSDDGRRYRVVNPLRPVLYHPHDRAAQGVPTPDGVTLKKEWSKDRPSEEPLAPGRLVSNDATTVYQLPDGTFELYSVALVPVDKTDPAYMSHDNIPGFLRVVDRYTSEDGLHFETRQRVIQRDATDPVDQQFYYLSVTPTSKGRVGMLGHYRCQAQTMDIEWCYSRDGVKWERPQREAWLPRGVPPSPDCYGIYANHQLVEHAGQWHLFYTGVNSAHNGKHSYGPPREVIMYAITKTIWV